MGTLLKIGLTLLTISLFAMGFFTFLGNFTTAQAQEVYQYEMSPEYLLMYSNISATEQIANDMASKLEDSKQDRTALLSMGADAAAAVKNTLGMFGIIYDLATSAFAQIGIPSYILGIIIAAVALTITMALISMYLRQPL